MFTFFHHNDFFKFIFSLSLFPRVILSPRFQQHPLESELQSGDAPVTTHFVVVGRGERERCGDQGSIIALVGCQYTMTLVVPSSLDVFAFSKFQAFLRHY